MAETEESYAWPPIRWDSPTWGNGVHVASNGSWLDVERREDQ